MGSGWPVQADLLPQEGGGIAVSESSNVIITYAAGGGAYGCVTSLSQSGSAIASALPTKEPQMDNAYSGLNFLLIAVGVAVLMTAAVLCFDQILTTINRRAEKNAELMRQAIESAVRAATSTTTPRRR